jgi:transketolase C-terminal domain/subunit
MTATAQATRELTMSEALNEGLREEMARDEAVFVIGEDIARHGGLFKVTEGLLDEFGPARVIDSPISEAGISGAGVGAALVGARPVVELQISDFVTLAMDQGRQSCGEVALHVGRASLGPAGDSRSDLQRNRHGGAALAEPRGVVRAHAGARGRHACNTL